MRPQPFSTMPGTTCLVTLNMLVEVGVDHRVPVVARHLQEHAVARDAGVVDQHVDRAVLGLMALVKACTVRIPVGDVADRGVEGVALRLLLADPLGEVARRAAAGDDLEAFLVQALADGGADAAHAAGDVSHFLCHCLSPSFACAVQSGCGGRRARSSGFARSFPVFSARRSVQHPCHRRCTATRCPSSHRGAASRAAASPGCGSPTHRSGGRWRSRRR